MQNYQGISNQDMLTAVTKNKLEGKVLGAKLSPLTPGMNIQFACGTGLEAPNLFGLKIGAGQIKAGIAGETDVNSYIPLVCQRKLSHFMIKLQNTKAALEKLKLLTSFNPSTLKPQIPAVMVPPLCF